MEVVGQSLETHFAALMGRLTGANGTSGLAFDDRIDGFDFPALPIQAI